MIFRVHLPVHPKMYICLIVSYLCARPAGPCAANPSIMLLRCFLWIRGSKNAPKRLNLCRQCTQNAYMAVFVDWRLQVLGRGYRYDVRPWALYGSCRLIRHGMRRASFSRNSLSAPMSFRVTRKNSILPFSLTCCKSDNYDIPSRRL